MAGPIVDLVVLRGLFADTALRPGLVLAAKVLERDGPRGTLLLAGVRVAAQLPAELAAGQALRVRVQHVDPERLTLQVLPRPDAAPATGAQPHAGLALPGGLRLRVEPDDAGGGAEGGDAGRRSVALRFDSPALGRIDLLLEVAADRASATVGVAAGAAATARGAAGELRDGLARATERPATVRVQEREESLDVRA